MFKMRLTSTTLLLLIVVHARSQQIQNIKPVVNGEKVTITYDLIDPSGKQYIVKIYASKDGGVTYGSELKFLTGDINLVKSGMGKRVIWDAKKEWGYYDGTVQFKIEAHGKSVTLPDPIVTSTFKFEFISVKESSQGGLQIDFIVTAYTDLKFSVFRNWTYIFNNSGEKFYISNSFEKELVAGIPIKSSLYFKGLEPGSTTFPELFLSLCANGCNDYKFRNISVEQ